MVQCEMCGAESPSPKTVKVEGAELQVCDDCADFGTEVQTETESTTSTKYSTSSESTSSSSSSSSASSSRSGGRRRDMFDEMDEVVPDYDDRIRSARESRGLSQEDLADGLNEKASLIRKLERGDVLPSDDLQRKLERELDVVLSGGTGGEDNEWDSDTAGTGLTLGDMVKRGE